jgi:hypothetical protein
MDAARSRLASDSPCSHFRRNAIRVPMPFALLLDRVPDHRSCCLPSLPGWLARRVTTSVSHLKKARARVPLGSLSLSLSSRPLCCVIVSFVSLCHATKAGGWVHFPFCLSEWRFRSTAGQGPKGEETTLWVIVTGASHPC